jgi:pimeloyl-ACP methyl ester carboxylesterase
MPYVIVHGGWLGGSEWTPIARRLRAAGHEAYTPTLTGIGERTHLLSPDVDLATHVQDIVGLLECEDLHGVVLVGHSSGSMVISGVAERIPERLDRLVYVDTVFPANGQSFFDLLGEPASGALLELARTEGDGWRVPFPFAPPDAACVPFHPLATVTQPLAVNNPAAAALPRTFIFCTAKEDDWFFGIGGKIAAAARKARAAGWDYRQLPTGHSPHQEMPDELADLLLSLTG